MANNITIDSLSTTGATYTTANSGCVFNPVTWQFPSSGQWFYAIMYPEYESEGGTGYEYTAKITINTDGIYYFFLTGAGGYGGGNPDNGGGQCGGGGSGQGMAYNDGLYLCQGSTIYVVLPTSNNVVIDGTRISSNIVINAISPGIYPGYFLYYALSCTAGSGGDGVSNATANGTNGGDGGSGNTYVSSTSTSNGGTIETTPPIVIPGAGGNGGSTPVYDAMPGHAGTVGTGAGSITGGSNIVGAYNPPSTQNMPNWANFTFADGTASSQLYPLLLAGGQNEGAGVASFMIYYNASPPPA
jgi:hypothetical protein